MLFVLRLQQRPLKDNFKYKDLLFFTHNSNFTEFHRGKEFQRTPVLYIKQDKKNKTYLHTAHVVSPTYLEVVAVQFDLKLR